MTNPLPPSTDRLSVTLNSVLDAVKRAALDLNADIPSRQIVTTGSLAHDCEQVLVIGSGLMVDGNIPMNSGCVAVWTLVVTVDIVRCAPTVEDDGTTDVESVAESLGAVSTDVGILMEALSNMESASGSITFKPPSGNYRSTSLSVRMSLL